MAKGRRTVLPLPDGIAAAWDLPPDTVEEALGGGCHNTLFRAGEVVVRIENRPAESVVWENHNEQAKGLETRTGMRAATVLEFRWTR